MDKQQAWDAFYATGSVEAYLNYKNASAEDLYEDKHRRTDTQKQSNR